MEDKPDERHVQQYQHELIVWAAEQVRREFLETSWRAFWATVIGQWMMLRQSQVFRLAAFTCREAAYYIAAQKESGGSG